MEKFDPTKFGKTVFWVVCAAAVGIATQLDTIGGFGAVEWTTAGVVAFVYGVLRSALGWARQTDGFPEWLKKVL